MPTNHTVEITVTAHLRELGDVAQPHDAEGAGGVRYVLTGATVGETTLPHPGEYRSFLSRRWRQAIVAAAVAELEAE